jgi:hypothetical protein
MIRARPSSPLVASALVFVVGAALGSSGCSFLIVRPPPARADWPDPVTPHSSQLRCTSTVAPPVIDATVALGLGTLAYVERDSSVRVFSPIVAAAALPYLVSAFYGAFEVTRCRSYEGLFAAQK